MLTSRATKEEVKARGTWAVADTDGTRELDEVSSSQVVLSDQRLLRIDNIIHSCVGVEVGLNVIKDHDRAISASAATTHLQPRELVIHWCDIPECTSGSDLGRYSNGVVEGAITTSARK